MSVYVTNKSLFVKTPESPRDVTTGVSISDLVSSLKQLDLSDLLDLTYTLLTTADHRKLTELLAIWKIRLLLLLVSNDLESAKREGVNLNNALYLRENSMAADFGSNGTNDEVQEVHPLPKNNDGVIHYELLNLMLRLKSTVQMGLVNEVYKLGYQLRIKNPDKLKLQNLSYHVMAILLVTKNYWTVFNFIKSLVFELSQQSTNDADKVFLSHATAMEFLMQRIMGIPTSMTETAFLDHLSEETKDSMKYIFKSETIYQTLATSTINVQDVCSLLGLWEFANTYNAGIENGEFVLREQEASDDIEQCYQLIFPHWKDDYSRVFCFES